MWNQIPMNIQSIVEIIVLILFAFKHISTDGMVEFELLVDPDRNARVSFL